MVPFTVRSQRVASSRAISRLIRAMTVASFTVAGVTVTCCPTTGAWPVSNTSTNASRFRRLVSALLPNWKTVAWRKLNTVATEPSCRKPKPRT
jgi:uncharacterized membrane protein